MRERDADREDEEGRLTRSRRQAKDRLADFRESMGRELGTAPKKAYLLLLLAAGATGFAVALRTFRRRRLRR